MARGGIGIRASRVQTADDDPDLYPTPPFGGRAGAAIALRLDPFARTALECACGLGHMAYALRDYFADVLATDLHDYGFGAVYDFLSPGPMPRQMIGEGVDWVITNPPFKYAAAFVRKAWETARRGVAMLLRLSFLESEERHQLDRDIRLAMCCPFVERVAMKKGHWDPEGSTAMAYAWFFWIKPAVMAIGGELQDAIAGCWRVGGALTLKIPPGQKRALTRPDDARLFGGWR